jgi:hypothetical protein
MPTPLTELSRPEWPYEPNGRPPTPDLSALPREEAERARARLAKLHGACGCAAGALVGLAALGAYIGLVLGLGLIVDSRWITVGVGAALFVLATGAGKTLGLMWARYQRDRLLEELHWRVGTIKETSSA